MMNLEKNGDTFIVKAHAQFGPSIEGSFASLRNGGVYDACRDNVVFRVWSSRERVYAVYQFTHDGSWPHDVAIFRLPDRDGPTAPEETVTVVQFLVRGNGIPGMN